MIDGFVPFYIKVFFWLFEIEETKTNPFFVQKKKKRETIDFALEYKVTCYTIYDLYRLFGLILHH